MPHAPQDGSRTSGEGGPLASRPKETHGKHFFLVSHCLRAAAANYEFLPVGALPTHRAVKLTLKLGTLREPAKSLRKPKTIPHPEPGDGGPQEPQARWDPQEPRTLRRNPRVKPEAGAPRAQAMWDAWTKTAEDWLLERAGIGQGDEGPYRGRGTAPAARMRMPLPIATHQRHGEVHGRAKIWTAQANRYRELARARLEHRQHYGDPVVEAIAANPEGKGPLVGPKGSQDCFGQGHPRGP